MKFRMIVLALFTITGLLDRLIRTNASNYHKDQTVLLCEGTVHFLYATLPWTAAMSNRSSQIYQTVTRAFSLLFIKNFQSDLLRTAHVRTEVTELISRISATNAKFRLYFRTKSLKQLERNIFSIDTRYTFREYLKAIMSRTEIFSASSFVVTDIIHLDDTNARYVQCKSTIYQSGQKMSWHEDLSNTSSTLFNITSKSVTENIIGNIYAGPLSASLRSVCMNQFTSFRGWILLSLYVKGHTTINFDYDSLVQLDPRYVSSGSTELFHREFQWMQLSEGMEDVVQCDLKVVPSAKEMKFTFLSIGGVLYENESAVIWQNAYRDQSTRSYSILCDLVKKSIRSAFRHTRLANDVKRISDIFFNIENHSHVYSYATIRIKTYSLYDLGIVEYETVKQWLVDLMNSGLERANLSFGFWKVQLI